MIIIRRSCKLEDRSEDGSRLLWEEERGFIKKLGGGGGTAPTFLDLGGGAQHSSSIIHTNTSGCSFFPLCFVGALSSA